MSTRIFVLARSQASADLRGRVFEAAASGTLMGFGFGGVSSAISYGKTSKLGKALRSEGLSGALISLGKTMDSGSATQKFALELDGKSKLSNADVGKLYGLISKEAKDMTPAQIFEKAIAARAAQEGTISTQFNKNRAQYLILKDAGGEPFVDVTEDIFDVNDGASVARMIQKAISERFHNLVDVRGQTIQINKTTNDEYRQSRSARMQQKRFPQAYKDKLRTLANADEIIYSARNWIGEQLEHERKDDIVEFARADISYRVDGKGYVAQVLVGTRKNGAAVLYDIVNISEKEITEAPVTMAGEKHPQRRQNTSVASIVAQEVLKVKESRAVEAEIAAFNTATDMGVTTEEFAQADTAAMQDSEAAQRVHAARAASNEPYTPPTSKDIKTYTTQETDAYSRALSRKVRFYDGASHAHAEAGFAENGVVYINKNAPVNRNSVAVVLAHEYVHTTEGTDVYTKLADAVFASKSYKEKLRSRGLTQNEYLQQIAENYKNTPNPTDPKKEAVAKFLSEYVLQDVNVLMDLARTDRNVFQRLYTQIRRFIARLSGKAANRSELLKLERLFAKAAKAANTVQQTQKSPAIKSRAQYMMGEHRIDKYNQRSYTNHGWVVVNGVLSDAEYASFNKQLSEAIQQGYRYPKSNNGEYMITVGDIYSFKDDNGHTRRMQHANKIVFVSGTVQNPIISRVVEVDYTIVDDVSYYVEGVIENEQYGIDFVAITESFEDKTIFRTYGSQNFPSFAEIQQRQKGEENSNPFDRNANRGDQQQRRGSGTPSSGSTGVSYSLPSKSTSDVPAEITTEQQLERDAAAVTARLLDRARAVENAPAEIAPVLDRIMAALDKRYFAKLYASPSTTPQTPSLRVQPNISKQNRDSTNTPPRNDAVTPQLDIIAKPTYTEEVATSVAPSQNANSTVRNDVHIAPEQQPTPKVISFDVDVLKNNTDAASLEKDSIALYRRHNNASPFTHLTERMSKRHIKQLAKSYGIDLKNIVIKIDNNSELLRSDFMGSSDMQSGGTIFFYPNTFQSKEQLLRTIYHESLHIQQYRQYGFEYVYDHYLDFEKMTTAKENSFIDELKKKGEL